MRLFRTCRKRRPTAQPGEILDQVISESTSAATNCLLYRLANYKRGGQLVDTFTAGGAVAVERLLRAEYSQFMYHAGKGQQINRAEYLRWKYMDNQQVRIPIEAALSAHDPLGKWRDHRACWQMQYRGRLGESLLHVLIICDSRLHTKLARLLLRVYPPLALDVMEGEEYLGASALHLAIAYSNNELVRDLIEAGADVSQRAVGSFFLPRDQQRQRASRVTDYEGLAYMGELPLAWAACCANESVYNLLIDHDADPDEADQFGNMILHMVVVCDKLDMFGYALRHPRLPARNGMANRAGLTPLTLACQLGRAEVFREMLELSAREFWRYSNITCSGYPLNALDTLLPDGRTNWNSALFIILNGTKEEHLDMLDGGIIQRLLEEKWKTFAQNQFLKRLLILFVHLFFLSLSVYLRPATENMAIRAELDAARAKSGATDTTTELTSDDADADDDASDLDSQQIIRYGCEVATLIGVLSYVLFQQGDEIRNQGIGAYLKQLANAPAKAIFLLSNVLLLACIPFRIRGDTDTEEAILVFAVPASWFLLMFFAGAIRLTGPFVTMIFSMITGDMFTFGIIYVIVLFGFSQAFYFLFKGHPQVDQTLFATYPSTWMALFQTTLGDYNYPDLNNTTYPNLAKTVFVIFMIFVPILLLNMLIAMMGNTYAHVIEQSEKEWMKQWAKIVVTLERAVSQSDAQKYLEAYSIPLGPVDDSGYETRGVMVIKSKSKTRAKQRRGAVSNWKRVGRVTLAALKKRGLTGEQLRRIMWGRASISSPAKVSKKRGAGMDLYGSSALLDGAADGLAGLIPMDSATLDVMSFAADFVMPPVGGVGGAEVAATAAITNVTGTAAAVFVQSPRPATATGGSIKPAAATTPAVAGQKPAATGTAAAIVYEDPLRELVLISEAIGTGADAEILSSATTLAKQATTLTNVREVHATPTTTTTATAPIVPSGPTKATSATGATGNTATMFQDASTIVDPVKELEFLRRLEAALDGSGGDSGADAMADEQPVLGKISLLRRAKSALVAGTAAAAAAERKPNDRHPLFNVAWREATAAAARREANGATNPAFVVDCGGEGDGDDAEPVTTAEEVRRHMEAFHMRKCQKPDASGRVMDEKTGKLVRNRRVRTAKNKVSPTEDDADDEDQGPRRRTNGSTAGGRRRARTAVDGRQPYDPLQPWSTRDLASMNDLMDSTD